MRFLPPIVPHRGVKKHSTADGSTSDLEEKKDGRVELQEEDCYDQLGFSFPWIKKWTILTVIFVVQCSMNFNASVYGSSVDQLAAPKEEGGFARSPQSARIGQAVMLIFYAFGCELWAPWSEEIGRWPVLQASLFLVNIWQILCALAPNWGSILVGRALVGLSSAGGSVTLGMVADMWEPSTQQFAVGYVVLSSVGGSVLGPVFGGFIGRYLPWQWNFWVQLIFGAVTQVLHFFLVPETRTTVIMDKIAKKARKSGENPNLYGPNEIRGSLFKRLPPKELATTMLRPFRMFLTEPIVLCLSLLSGFSDALIFTFLEAYHPVYEQWGFGTIALGLSYLPLLIGYFIAWFTFMPFFARDQKYMAKHGAEAMQPERRLYWLLYMAPLETIGLFGFAWTSSGPQKGIPWIAPMIFSTLVGMANYAIYMATIDYMVAAYGPYSASATGGNGFARDLLAGIAAFYSAPFYEHFETYTLEYPSTILACIAIVVTIPVYVFYWKGPQIRARSKFAQTLAGERTQREGRRASMVTADQLQRQDDADASTMKNTANNRNNTSEPAQFDEKKEEAADRV
ncbi:major facilitator superfamily domain-containing protein [Elsinoe ampelina]|uniref:Major facilitator superfamily domain-containing protein n=1 Tax=Elsinoe ampelina TaxID=302913 RepID=A0A6A6G518_9PEZI|nr:major facilitator superfamily domain-containing protein [Elsinoe ampelina]